MGLRMSSSPALPSSSTSQKTSHDAGDLVVAVVGQVPPPLNGQSLMIQQFLNGTYPGMRLLHVPMEFSRSTAEIGSFGMRKLFLLGSTLLGIVRARLRGATVLYYPPASPNLTPVLRDLALLLPTRWLFHRTVFHFHAAGLCGIYPRLPRLLRPFFRLAYGTPDLAIFTTQLTAADAAMLHARQTAVVPCGIPDHASTAQASLPTQPNATPVLLFAGILCEGKGVMVLLEMCRLLQEAGEDFRLVCLGAFQSAAFQNEVEHYLQKYGLQQNVSFPGVFTGADKANAFASADIFCFPSHYAAESFGVVLIEAMSYSLPIVATTWQGIPEVTSERGTLLIPIQDPTALSDAVRLLLHAPELRTRMGALNRARYLANFTMERYREQLAGALQSTRTVEEKV